MSERLIRAIEDVRDLPESTLGSIVDKIGDESVLIICLISILPFMQPIPIPGVSTLLGFVAFLQGLSLIFHGRPLMTKRMREIHLSRERLEMIHKAAVKVNKFTSKLSLFKSEAITHRSVRMICGVTIMMAAAFLSLPLPIPLSNFIPALCIFFIVTGLLECDLMLVLFGHGIALGVAWMAMASYQIIYDRFF
ncbi:MAG: exopolysaccharide biosynthesis protein [Bacteriovoracaceae bacterium]